MKRITFKRVYSNENKRYSGNQSVLILQRF